MAKNFIVGIGKIEFDPIDDKELEKMVKEMQAAVKALQGNLKGVKSSVQTTREASGDVYNRCDSLMQEKNLAPDKKKALTALRKQAYDLGVSTKGLLAMLK